MISSGGATAGRGGEAGEEEVFQMADANQRASCCSVVPSVCAREKGGRQSPGPCRCRDCRVCARKLLLAQFCRS